MVKYFRGFFMNRVYLGSNRLQNTAIESATDKHIHVLQLSPYTDEKRNQC